MWRCEDNDNVCFTSQETQCKKISFLIKKEKEEWVLFLSTTNPEDGVILTSMKKLFDKTEYSDDKQIEIQRSKSLEELKRLAENIWNGLIN